MRFCWKQLQAVRLGAKHGETPGRCYDSGKADGRGRLRCANNFGVGMGHDKEIATSFTNSTDFDN
jgi:hypothetical protein